MAPCRIFYTQQGGYDTHANENPTQPPLLSDLSGAIMDFFQDLRDHDSSEEVAMLVFTECRSRPALFRDAAWEGELRFDTEANREMSAAQIGRMLQLIVSTIDYQFA